MLEPPADFGCDKAAIAVLAEAAKLECRRDDVTQCDALILAGWKFVLPELVNPDMRKFESEPWQWYWRRPARRKGSKGRLFLSTNQAYNAMRKDMAKA